MCVTLQHTGGDNDHSVHVQSPEHRSVSAVYYKDAELTTRWNLLYTKCYVYIQALNGHAVHTCHVSSSCQHTNAAYLSINGIHPPIYLDVRLQQDMQLAPSISMQLIMAWAHVNIDLPSIFWYCNTGISAMPLQCSNSQGSITILFLVAKLFY